MYVPKSVLKTHIQRFSSRSIINTLKSASNIFLINIYSSKEILKY